MSILKWWFMIYDQLIWISLQILAFNVFLKMVSSSRTISMLKLKKICKKLDDIKLREHYLNCQSVNNYQHCNRIYSFKVLWRKMMLGWMTKLIIGVKFILSEQSLVASLLHWTSRHFWCKTIEDLESWRLKSRINQLLL